MIDKFDVMVVGSGMVGLTAALAIAKKGHKVAIIAPNLSVQPLSDKPQRVSAINLASANAFKNLGVWQSIVSENRHCSYQGMQVWDKNSVGRIAFSASDEKLDSLGYIIENQLVENALLTQILTLSNITLYQHKAIQLDQDEHQAMLQLENGQLLQAKLLIAADGANSQLRRWLNIPLTFSDYGQTALVATVKTADPHHKIARQVFTPKGPLAFLPLADSNTCSIVWSQTHDTAAKLMSLAQISELEFNKKLTAELDGVLGQVELMSAINSFKLTMRYAQSFIQDTCLLIGDAAHTIHPLAGQGANLGILDALAVAQTVSLQLSEQAKINHTELKQVMRWRQADAVERIAAMQLFKTGFSNDITPIKLVRGMAMNMVDNLKPIKSQFVKAALGTSGKLPELAQQQL